MYNPFIEDRKTFEILGAFLKTLKSPRICSVTVQSLPLQSSTQKPCAWLSERETSVSQVLSLFLLLLT